MIDVQRDDLRPHPAKFSDVHLAAARSYLDDEVRRRGITTEELRVLDSFAGTGLVHELPYTTVGVELEPEWASYHPDTIVGNATDLAAAGITPGSFGAYFTSTTFANRMADTYDGSRDTCTTCRGTGCKVGADCMALHMKPVAPEVIPSPHGACERCEGTGFAPTTRNTYRISLGRMPSEGSACCLQWGARWRRLHRLAIVQAVEAVADEGLLLVNASDSRRTVSGELVYPKVVEFLTMTLLRAGCYLVAIDRLETKRQGNGANREVRAAWEHLIVVRKGRPTMKSDLA